jgi:hypothetical protein
MLRLDTVGVYISAPLLTYDKLVEATGLLLARNGSSDHLRTMSGLPPTGDILAKVAGVCKNSANANVTTAKILTATGLGAPDPINL